MISSVCLFSTADLDFIILFPTGTFGIETCQSGIIADNHFLRRHTCIFFTNIRTFYSSVIFFLGHHSLDFPTNSYQYGIFFYISDNRGLSCSTETTSEYEYVNDLATELYIFTHHFSGPGRAISSVCECSDNNFSTT